MLAMSEGTIIIYSGGLDSTILMYHLKSRGQRIKALGINYGQRHIKELVAAEEICAELDVEFSTGDLSGLGSLLAGNSLTTAEVNIPDGHYAEESMRITVVPNRNMLMFSVGIAWAINSNFDSVAYAAHAGDHAIYPDCRPEFAYALANAARLCHYRSIEVRFPFIRKTKTEIVKLGHQLGVPFASTWSCYKGEEQHCGRCGTCTERAEAFVLAGVPDPTVYFSKPHISTQQRRQKP